MTYSRLGWDEFFSNHYTRLDLPADVTPGRITGVHKNRFTVSTGDLELTATAKGTLGRNPEELIPAVGDWVALRHNVIIHVLPRKNCLSRGASGSRHKTSPLAWKPQIIAANLDTVFVVCGLDRDYRLSRIERYLTLVLSCGCSPVVLLTKADLHPNPGELLPEVASVAGATPVHMISATTGQGLDALEPYLAPGNTVALIGSSGTGKSTLVNALTGADIKATQLVSQCVGKGIHTTTSRDMILLRSGAMIIDNPGLREIALWEMDGGLDTAFRDITELAMNCRFSDCTHTNEPGCQVLEAIAAGQLQARRMDSYHKMKQEMDYLIRRRDTGADRLEKERWKAISKKVKQMKKSRG
ncbi:MAG: ribosome small subunit-dependent GTPase A [Pseudomonadota bacterium]